MRKIVVGFLALFFLFVSATTLFGGKRIDHGWSPDMYKYDIVSGEVTEIDHDSNVLELDEQPVIFTSKTEFFKGDMDADMESVYGGVKLHEKDKVMAEDIKKGKLMKCRYSRDEKGRLFIHTCVLEE